MALIATLAASVLVLSLLPGIAARAGIGGPGVRVAHEVRTVWTGDYGIPRPAGVAYDPGRRELLVAGAGATGTDVLRLSASGELRGNLRPPRLAHPSTLSFDAGRAATRCSSEIDDPCRYTRSRAPVR